MGGERTIYDEQVALLQWIFIFCFVLQEQSRNTHRHIFPSAFDCENCFDQKLMFEPLMKNVVLFPNKDVSRSSFQILLDAKMNKKDKISTCQ